MVTQGTSAYLYKRLSRHFPFQLMYMVCRLLVKAPSNTCVTEHLFVELPRAEEDYSHSQWWISSMAR